MKRYVGKTQFLAILLIGGQTEEHLQKKGYSEEEIAEAKKLLLERGFEFGACPNCKDPSWLQKATILEPLGNKMFRKSEYRLCGACLSPIVINARKKRWKIKGEGKWKDDMEWPPKKSKVRTRAK